MNRIKRHIWSLLFILCICFAVLTLFGCQDTPPATDGTHPPLGATPPHVHEVIEHEGTSPTCTEEGYRPYYTCATCDYTTYTPIAPVGHTYTPDYRPNGDVHSRFCTGCSQTIDLAHEWQMESIIKEPSCVNAGICRLVCFCGATATDTIPSTGEHTEGSWQVSVQAGALTKGKEILRCAVCRTPMGERDIPAQVESMPIMFLEGDYASATSKKNDVKMTVRYVDPDGTSFSSYALIHVQGATSAGFPKKNYTIKFYKDEACTSKYKVDLGWGKESKYCMKANWVDSTQARNIVSCRIWRDVVQTRATSAITERLLALPTNAGGIDGFPMAVYMNGEFYGLYTMNVPKDEWMFGMDDVETEALLCANDWVNTDFNVLLGEFTLDSYGDYTTNKGGWELKYFGTEKTTGSSAWVTESFNNLIRFCQENEGAAFKAGISQYMDVDAAIDYLLYCYAIYMRDNTSKNILWATYDGVVWIPSVYDQDGTFGMAWDGYRYAAPTGDLPRVKNGEIINGFNTGSTNFLLWNRMWDAFTEEILLRYKELRESVLTKEHMCSVFDEFRTELPASIYVADQQAWAAERSKWWASNKYANEDTPDHWYEPFDYTYTYDWIEQRLLAMDDAIRVIYEQIYLPSTNQPKL